jgi:uncharacterized heparinase superfamily protein
MGASRAWTASSSPGSFVKVNKFLIFSENGGARPSGRASERGIILPGATLTQRLRLARRVARYGAARLRQAVSAPFRAAAALRAGAPDRVVIVPRDIRTTDTTIADDIYAGYFAFGGKIVNAHGRSPFEIEAAPSWERALAGFGWLRHLRAADTALARANAQALVGEFLALRGKPHSGPAWETRVTARRMLSWLTQSPLLLEGVDEAYYRRVMRGLARARADLRRALGGGEIGVARLFAAIALMQFALCTRSTAKEQKRAVKTLAEELSRQILPDGGHVSRNPQVLIDLMLDLLPLRQAFVARSVEPPRALIESIDRIPPMLRLFRLGDGALALFNGMGATAPEVIATLIAYDDPRGRALLNAPHSGYQRIEAGDGLLVMDCGKPPPPDFSRDAHGGCLSFEFGFGADRIIVNCGAPDANRAAARAAARATAAHSTLVVADTSSCRVAAHSPLHQMLEGQILSGPERVEATRVDAASGFAIAASHDGYLAAFGLTHERRLTLSADGARLDGEDRLTPEARRGGAAADADVEYAIRFHLHPGVATLRLRDDAVLLDLPGGARFLFETADRPIDLEESVFFASPHGPRATGQIVIRARTRETLAVAWRLARVADEEAPVAPA